MTKQVSGVPSPQEPEITEEMVEAGARSLADTIDPSMRVPNYLRGYARAALSAALAGRTVVALPDPTDAAVATWDTGNDFTVRAVGGSFGARVNIRGGPYLTANAAESRAAVLLAAAREARRLASESRKDGETP